MSGVYMTAEVADLVARAIRALDKLDAETDEGDISIYLGTIPVMVEGEKVGELRDEIGGAWAFYGGGA